MQKTSIEYLTHTWNPIAMRCTGISPGCEHCWHLRTADRLGCNEGLPLDERKALIGDGPFILRDRELSAPLRAKNPAVIGVQFMGDLFHEAVPDEFIGKAYHQMFKFTEHTYLILTKRPHRMVDMIPPQITDFPHIYHGLTICNQQEADEKIPIFLQVPGNLWICVEPMLSEINLHLRIKHDPKGKERMRRDIIKGVVLGGETGPGARPMHPEWVRSVRDQCAEAGVPFFFKQWGKHRPGLKELFGNHYECRLKQMPDRYEIMNAGRLLDGRTHDDLPWAD